MIHSVSNLPHRKYLNSGVKVRALPENLRTSISELENNVGLLFSSDIPSNEITAKLNVYIAESNIIKETIEANFIEKPIVKSYASKNDLACAKLFDSGKLTEITTSDFEKAGGDIGFYSDLGHYGFKTSNFSLTKDKRESTYTLKKL